MIRVFAIGLPHSGGTVVQSLFDANGIIWRHRMAGNLAMNIAYARAAGLEPLMPWGKAVGFSGLWGPDKTHMPALPAYGMFRFLHDHFPDAYFVHTSRDAADWVAARFFANDGAHRTACAAQLGVSAQELPAIWLEQHAKHRADCHAYFDQNPRFIDVDINNDPIAKLRSFFEPTWALDPPEITPDLSVSAHMVNDVLDRLDMPPPATIPACDPAFVRRVAAHCYARTGHDGPTASLSSGALVWDAGGGVKTRKNQDAPVAQRRRADPYLIDPKQRTFERATLVLSQLDQLGARPPLNIDMMDARFLGTKGHRAAPARTLAYNRRDGAHNLTLWPLPGYHSLAPTGRSGGFDQDIIPFLDKADHAVWLGNMTGRMSDTMTPDGREKRTVYGIRAQVETTAPDSADWDGIIGDLDCVPRYRFVKTHRTSTDITARLVLRGKWDGLQNSPAFDGLCHDFMGPKWFHKNRYIISLAGNDTGSNFLFAAASNCVILKEEDGWELFYSGEFKPWVHYIPLTHGGGDVIEKLAWARANQAACADMAANSRAVFDQFANPNNQAAFLKAIVQNLNNTAL